MRVASGLIAVFVVATSVFAQPEVKTSSADSSALGGSLLRGEEKAALTAHVRGIAQDQRGNMWFATDGEGLVRWDGKAFTHFTEKQGLPNDYVRTVQVDGSGELWITTRDGLCRYDGNAFTRVPVPADSAPPQPTPDLMWFEAKGGAMYYDGAVVRFLRLPVDEADKNWRSNVPDLHPYSVYKVHGARDGTVWFGTETRGVCKWDGKKFSWLREVDLDKSAVRAIYRDTSGNMWFGNSGVGLFRFDGKELRNFGIDNNIENLSWLQNMPRQMPGRIADPHAIMQDKAGNVWIGVFDSGAWRYDGKNITNFTKKDGLSVDSVSAIYEDRAGKLWFGTLEGVCTWDGKRFERVGEAGK